MTVESPFSHPGQWEAAAVGEAGARGYATPTSEFAARLTDLAELVTGLTRRPIWLMTTDYSPLGCIRLWCPALDHRLPPVTEAYTRVAIA